MRDSIKKPGRKGGIKRQKNSDSKNLRIPNPPFLPHTAKETIEFLAQLRYPKDEKKRQTFIRNPGTVTLSAKEIVYLNFPQKLQEALSRLDTVERTAKALSPQDVTYSIGQQILTKISLADSHHQKGHLTQFYSVLFDIERLCGKANIAILGPHAQRGKRSLAGAKKPRPREDPLNNLLASPRIGGT